mgnify:CR=1 FL=1
MRKWLWLTVILASFIAVPQVHAAVKLSTTQTVQQQHLQEFVTQRLLTKQGIYTNYLDTKQRTTTASGHEMLSESAGYYLQHLVLTGQKKAFRTFYQQTVTTFYSHDQFSYRYDPRTKKRSTVNASVDDLRILNSLLAYDQTFKTTHYQKTATSLYRDLQQHSLIKGRLYDYADGQTGKHAPTITLCYLNLKTLRHFEGKTAKGRQQWQRQLKLVKRGYLGSVAPLYKTRYNYQRKVYTNSKELNIVESLLTMLHLAEVDQLPTASQQWLQQQVAAGKLYNRYDQKGKALTSDQSAGGYALAAMIGQTTGNAKLYQAAIQHVATFQITTQSSPLYGGLGDAATKQAYSFDNLTALVAYDLAL